jgi:hypothetical protein
MSKRYTYSTCLMFGTDGEADHCEIDVTVSYEVAWLDDDGQRGEIEDIRVESIDADTAEKADPVAVAEAFDVFECGRFDDAMLTHASEEWAEDYADALDRRDEAKRERAWLGDY